MRVHDVERHLHGVKLELVLRGHLQHPQMHHRIFVPGEAEVAKLAGLLRLDHRLLRAVFLKDAVRVFHPDDLVMLHQVNAVGLQALQRFVNLLARRAAFVRPSIFVIRNTWSR